MAIKNRSDLKSYFVKNAIPTEGNFADLVDSQLNQAQDGVFKLEGEPLSVVAAAGNQKRVLRLYADYPAANPDWLISLKPAQDPANAATIRPGFGITDGAGNTKLFIDQATGNLGVGTNNPADKLTVEGGDVLIRGGNYRRLKIVSDQYWAGIELVAREQGGVAGNPHIDFTHGNLDDPNFGVRVHASTNSVLNVSAGSGTAVLDVAGQVNASGGLMFEGLVAHINRDGAMYRNTDGQCYITVDDNLYIRDSGATTWAMHFDTNGNTLNVKGAVNASALQTVGGNAGALNMIGTDHVYIQWYPQGTGAGRKGWLGYGGAGVTTMHIVNDAGDIRFNGGGNVICDRDADFNGNVQLGYARYQADFNAVLKSGFYQQANPTGGVPDTAHGWQHMIECRHSNTANHHALQIASTYAENDRLFFRKIARDLGDGGRPGWNELATVTGGVLKIGDWVLSSEGNNLYIKRGGSVVARFSTEWDRLLVFRNTNGAQPYFYYNAGGSFGEYRG